MKKLLTLLTLGVMAIPTTYAQSQRMVLLEHFTQASCPPCATYNPRIKDLVNANPDKIIAIKYQTSWPGVDPMNAQNPAQVATRVSYYGVSGVPNSVLDGNFYNGHPQQWSLSNVETRRQVQSPFDLTLTSNLNDAGDSIFVSLNIKATKALTGVNLKSHIAVIERVIEFSKPPGSNGETEFEHVMKRMLPSETGTDIKGNWTVGQDTTIKASWKLANIYSLPQLGVVAFVQNPTTKEVHQAVYEKTPIPFELAVDGKSSAAKSTISSDATQTLSTSFSTTDSVASDYDFKLTSTLPTDWSVKFTIDGQEYTDKATVSVSKAAAKTVNVIFTMPAGAKNQKASASLSVNNSSKLTGYKVNASFSAFSSVSTMYVNTDAATSNSKMTTALKSNNKDYLVATGEEFESFDNTAMSKSNIGYIWFNTGASLGGGTSESAANNLIAYIEKGGKLLLTSPMLGFDAYYGTKNPAIQDLWTNYLGQEPFAYTNPANDLEKDGKTINPIQNELVLGPLYSTPASTPASTTPAYGTNLYAADGQTLILTYDEDPDMGAAVRAQNDETGMKYVFSTIRFDLVKETAFRNTMVERIYKFFDGEPLGVNSIAANNSMELYPNPSNVETKISFDKATTASSDIKVFNTLGQEVYSNILPVGTKSFNLNTAVLGAGLYTVKIQSNGNVLATSKLNVVK